MDSIISMHIAHIILGLMMAVTFIQSKTRRKANLRKWSDWLIDGTSLAFHFFAIPAIAFWSISWLKENVASEYIGFIKAPGFLVTICGLMVVDYLWYWNHRFFHADTLFWNLHEVHHNARVFDIFMSARNTIWLSLIHI